MKIRDSGMPGAEIWSSFFNVSYILSVLDINSTINDVAEVGCGYGIFTIPTAKLVRGKVYAFDIEEEMINIVNEKSAKENIENISALQRDVLQDTTGLKNESVDYVMLFNILHNENPAEILSESYRVLTPNGKVGIIHWRSDITTPRGPGLNIRPTHRDILSWIDLKMFSLLKYPFIIQPYHFGLILTKNGTVQECARRQKNILGF